MEKSEHHTIGILSALAEVEHPAVLAAFGIDPNAKPRQTEQGERYWETSITRDDELPLRIVISCIAGSGNSTAEIPVERLVKEYNPESMFFVGIACGVRDFHLGDVVTAEVIWAYEYAKTTTNGQLNRSRAISGSVHLSRDIGFFNDHERWRDKFDELLQGLPTQPRGKVTPQLKPSIWIASGEKVLGNGELGGLNKLHDKIRAGEMEGFGFGQACEKQRPAIPWMVVRGISDYGDPSKDGPPSKVDGDADTNVPLKDEYHGAAALSAATFLRRFLETSYSPFGVSSGTDKNATGTLSDRQIAVMANNGLLISEEFSQACVKQACYEVRVGDVYYEVFGDRKPREVKQFGNVLLKPHQITVIITKETLNIPEDILGRILTKGRLFSVGVLPVNTYADPGFQGRLGIVLYNASPKHLIIQSGEPIAKIEFSQLSERVLSPYTGQHGYQSNFWPIPEEVIASGDELAGDSRVGTLEEEASLSYGSPIVELLSSRKRAEHLSTLALSLSGLAFVLVLLNWIVGR